MITSSFSHCRRRPYTQYLVPPPPSDGQLVIFLNHHLLLSSTAHHSGLLYTQRNVSGSSPRNIYSTTLAAEKTMVWFPVEEYFDSIIIIRIQIAPTNIQWLTQDMGSILMCTLLEHPVLQLEWWNWMDGLIEKNRWQIAKFYNVWVARNDPGNSVASIKRYKTSR